MSSTKTAVLLPFNELDADILPSDAAGSLDDLTDDGGTLTLPTIAEAVTGYGRVFSSGVGLIGTELVTGATRLRENLTIDGLIEFDMASAALSTDYTIVARGRGGAVSAAERVLYALVLRKISDTVAELALWWEDSSNVVSEVSAQFALPEGPCLFGASRHWNNVASVDVELTVNGDVVGTGTSTAGDIEGGDGGTFIVGCRGNGASAYQDHFLGTIDSLRVSRVARSAEELRQFWQKVLIFQPRMEQSVKSLLPTGVFSEDEDSNVQRFIAAIADAFGTARAKIAELAEDYLPNRAHAFLPDWESLLRLYVRPRDSIARRRERAAGGLAANGYNRPGMQKTLADAFDQAEADVTFLRYTNQHSDDLDGDLEDWWYISTIGAVTNPSAGVTALDVTLGTNHDYRLGNEFVAFQAIDGRPTEDLDDYGVGAYATLEVNGWTLDAETLAGIVAQVGGSRDLLLVGIQARGAGVDWGWREFVDQQWSAWTVIATTEASGAPPGAAVLTAIPPHWVMRYNGAGSWDIAALENDPYTTEPGTGADDQQETIATNVSGPTWVGWGVMTEPDKTTVADSILEGIQWRSFFPLGTHPFTLQAYRNTALSGDPDMLGAKRLFERKKPADTEGGAVTVLVALYDDPESGYDEAPLA